MRACETVKNWAELTTLWTLLSFPNWSKYVRASINQSMTIGLPLGGRKLSVRKSPVTCQGNFPKRPLEPGPEAGELGGLDPQKVTVQHHHVCCHACSANPHLVRHLRKCCEQSWQYCRPPCSIHSLSFHKSPGIPESRLSGCCRFFVWFFSRGRILSCEDVAWVQLSTMCQCRVTGRAQSSFYRFNQIVPHVAVLDIITLWVLLIYSI